MNCEKPLTGPMLKSLCECYMRELAEGPSNPFSTKHCKGLIRRGMLEVLPYNNGRIVKHALYITRLGRETIEPIIKRI